MNNFLRNLSLILAAGVMGGLTKALVAWSFGASGINAFLGSQLAPPISSSWVYSHAVWGGIWALLFFLPIRGASYYFLGILYSLPQSLISLLVIFPSMNYGLLGLNLGAATPILILFFGIVWGVTTGCWLKLVEDNR